MQQKALHSKLAPPQRVRLDQKIIIDQYHVGGLKRAYLLSLFRISKLVKLLLGLFGQCHPPCSQSCVRATANVRIHKTSSWTQISSVQNTCYHYVTPHSSELRVVALLVYKHPAIFSLQE
ncbi:hypothetical protein Y032_0014g2303 [Ancylostoma ceylanicum]|uniref:Uncharacterized protein n=1 Tax=Ancylostoma ceylanicum TaxID=53326 RepID=A0A016VA01_9BILA|nr:hypothetical protein Y032_0014g2303 [Ancylostoma ceylanicum]